MGALPQAAVPKHGQGDGGRTAKWYAAAKEKQCRRADVQGGGSTAQLR